MESSESSQLPESHAPAPSLQVEQSFNPTGEAKQTENLIPDISKADVVNESLENDEVASEASSTRIKGRASGGSTSSKAGDYPVQLREGRSGRTIKRPKFADEVVATGTSYEKKAVVSVKKFLKEKKAKDDGGKIPKLKIKLSSGAEGSKKKGLKMEDSVGSDAMTELYKLREVGGGLEEFVPSKSLPVHSADDSLSVSDSIFSQDFKSELSDYKRDMDTQSVASKSTSNKPIKRPYCKKPGIKAPEIDPVKPLDVKCLLSDEMHRLKKTHDEVAHIIATQSDQFNDNKLQRMQELMKSVNAESTDTVGIWKAEDDLRLVNAMQQLSDVDLVKKLVKFNVHFTVEDILTRWHALLYSPFCAKLSHLAMSELPPATVLMIQKEIFLSPVEEQLLCKLPATEKAYDVKFFEKMLEMDRLGAQIFNEGRTGDILLKSWNTLLKLGRVRKSEKDEIPTSYTEPMHEFQVDLENNAKKQLTSTTNPVFQNYDTELDSIHMELAKLDEEIDHNTALLVRNQHLVEFFSGIRAPVIEPKFTDNALAVLRGKKTRYLLYRTEARFGRSTPGYDPEIDLNYEGNASKIARHAGRIYMDCDGNFILYNQGQESMVVDGEAVLLNEEADLNYGSIITIRNISLLFYVNKLEVSKLLRRKVLRDNAAYEKAKDDWSVAKSCDAAGTSAPEKGGTEEDGAVGPSDLMKRVARILAAGRESLAEEKIKLSSGGTEAIKKTSEVTKSCAGTSSGWIKHGASSSESTGGGGLEVAAELDKHFCEANVSEEEKAKIRALF